MLQIEQINNVAVIKLNRSTINAINPELVNTLSDAVQDIKDKPEICGLVLGSANEKFFSIGLDIPELYKLDKEKFRQFYKAFNRLCILLYTVPKPTVAAITGHATAGGCIFALCCDYRYIAEGRKLMGLNEIKLGVPIPYPNACMLRDLVGGKNYRDIVDTGDFYEPEDSLRLGMVDKILPIHKVMEASIRKIEEINSRSRDAFTVIKKNRIEPVLEQINSRLAEKEEIFVDFWYSETTQENLKEAIKKY